MVRRMQQRLIDEYELNKEALDNHMGLSISESVRNATFNSIKGDLPRRRKEIYEIILMHPEGICSRAISEKHLKGKRIHTFSGRISELYNKYFKYGSQQLIEPCGVSYYPDDDGRMQPYTKWRAKASL